MTLFQGYSSGKIKAARTIWNILDFVKAGHCLKKLTAKMVICHEAENDWQHLPAKALPEEEISSVQH